MNRRNFLKSLAIVAGSTFVPGLLVKNRGVTVEQVQEVMRATLSHTPKGCYYTIYDEFAKKAGFSRMKFKQIPQAMWIGEREMRTLEWVYMNKSYKFSGVKP